MLVWALEPYFGGSHRSFLEGLSRFSGHQFRLHTLPGRHWKWRMQGGAFALAERAAREADRPQLLFASSMLDLPSYLALAPPEVSVRPVLLYFHENQLTYPLPPGVERDLTYGLKQFTSAVAADGVFFNTHFHRKEFLQALSDLLPELPDEAPRWAVERLAARAEVLPLGCDLRRFDPYRPGGRETGRAGGAQARTAGDRWGDPSRGPLILWNQRWEYDKAPGDFFQALYELKERGRPFRVAVAGPNQGLPNAAFVEARARLEEHIVHWGMARDFAEYAALLWEADVVVSTALHEFFGLAVVEAIYCGCRPVLPDRLSYPELVPAEVHGKVLYEPGGLVPMLERALEEPRSWSPDWQRTWVAPYDWGSIAPRYDAVIWHTWEEATARREGRCRWVKGE